MDKTTGEGVDGGRRFTRAEVLLATAPSSTLPIDSATLIVPCERKQVESN